jgi:hypothetical protein
VTQGLLATSGALNDTVRLVQAEAPDAIQDYRKRTAEVIAANYLDLVKPIVKDYPDSRFRAARKPDSGSVRDVGARQPRIRNASRRVFWAAGNASTANLTKNVMERADEGPKAQP